MTSDKAVERYSLSVVDVYPPGSEGWVENYRQEFSYIARAYAKNARVGKQQLAALMLARMAEIVDQLGIFDEGNEEASAPVIELLNMLRDLGHGRKHPLAEPAQTGGSNIETSDRREVRLWAIAAVKVLRRGRWGLNQSSRMVAQALTRRGYGSRQRKDSVPWQTIKVWYYKAALSPDEIDRTDAMASDVWEAAAAQAPADNSEQAQQHLAKKVLDGPLLKLISERFMS